MHAYPCRLARAFVLRVLLVLGLCCSASFAQERSPSTRSFDLPAGDAESAIKLFSQQSGRGVIAGTNVVKGVKTNAVKGEFTAAEALTMMLDGTGLVGNEDRKSGTFAVRKETTAETKNGSRAVADSGRPNRPGTTHTMESGEKVIRMDTFEVFAKKDTLNMDLPRDRDGVQPYVVFDAQTIEKSGVSNLGEFFKSRLPMSSTIDFADQAPGNTSAGMSAVNLRGLGIDQTLILIDGRRATGPLEGGTFRQPNLNGIPLSAIQRVEVLPTTASGFYGGSATGGVINIVLKRKYTGFDLKLTYGNTFDSDVAERRVELLGGFTLSDGKTRVMISGSLQDRNRLLGGDRDFTSRGRALLMSNNPNAFLTSNPPVGATPNIANLTAGANLVLKSGTVLNSPITSVPVGYAGPSTDSGAALVANQGHYNLDAPDDLNGRRSPLLSGVDWSESWNLNVRREMAPWLELFADGSFTRSQNSQSISTAPSTVLSLPASASNNPFTTAVRVSFPASPEEFPFVVSTESAGITGGAIARLPKDWKIAADYSWNRARNATTSSLAGVYGDPDGSGPGISVNTALANGTLNVIRDLGSYPLDYTPYKLPSPNQFTGPGETSQSEVTLRASGPTFQLQSGPVIVSALVSHRKANSEIEYSDNVVAGITSATFLAASQEAKSYYAETTIPLLGESSDKRFLRKIEIQLSARHDDYVTKSPDPTSASVLPLFGRTESIPAHTYGATKASSTDYSAGIAVSPFDGLVLRASHSTGFLPPTISQLVPRVRNVTASLTDPLRGSVANTITYTARTVGNPALVPEDSESNSAGLVWTPGFAKRLRISVDYTEISKRNEIASLTAQEILDLEEFLPDRVVRAPLSPPDAALGYTGGVIQSIDSTRVNLSSAKIRSLDLQVDYEWTMANLGTLQFYGIATKALQFERQTSPLGQPIEFVDFASGPLKWRGNAGVTWRKGKLTLGWNSQYYHSYKIYSATATSTAIATTVSNQGASRVPMQIYNDIYASYDFGDAQGVLPIFKNTDFSVGIQNIFDKHPPTLATASAFGASAYSRYGDPRMRRYQVSVRRRF